MQTSDDGYENRPLQNQREDSYSQLSVHSRSSLLSKQLIDSFGLPEIKSSIIKEQEKTVILWTPIVINAQFPSTIKKTKLSYRTG